MLQGAASCLEKAASCFDGEASCLEGAACIEGAACLERLRALRVRGPSLELVDSLSVKTVWKQSKHIMIML